jgi:hypothetical protein
VAAAATWTYLVASLGSYLSLLLLLLGLVADLDIGEMILIIAIDCAGHTILGNALLDATLIGTDQLVLSRIMLIVLVKRVPSNLDLPAINSDL